MKGPTARRRLPVLVGIALALIVVPLSQHWAQDQGVVQARPQTPLQAKIGPGVAQTVADSGNARVVIALETPQALQSGGRSLGEVREAVTRVQDEVLAGLQERDFLLQRRYETVPALAGTLRTEAGLERLAQQPSVRKVDLDVGGTGQLSDSVPLIGADGWHGFGVDGSPVVVAVLDSGLDTDHSDLGSALIHEACFLDDDGTIDGEGRCPNGSDTQIGPGAAEDDAGHGTHVTGIVMSRGNVSSVGVAPGASLVAIKISAGPEFSGKFFYFSEIVAALDYIAMNRPDVQVINMSFGTFDTFTGDCDDSTSYNMAGASSINFLRSNGVIAFASSGNNGSGTHMTSPACLSNVVSVGATDNSDAVAVFTNSNASTDLMAPGVDILSDALDNSTTTASGTSMASPHAAGCAALSLAKYGVLSPDELEARLESSPYMVTDPLNGLVFPRVECGPPAVYLPAILK